MATRSFSSTARVFEFTALALWTVFFAAGCGDAPSPKRSTVVSQDSISPEELLAKVRSKYAAAKSYSDNATLKQRGVNRSRGTLTEMPFTYLSLLIERPNRYTLSYEDALPGSQGKTAYRVVSDGKRIRSSASQLPGQIHEAITPRETTADNLIPEPELRSAILQVALENLFPQLVMFLSRDSEKPVFPRATHMEMLPEEKIGTTTCYRISLTEPEGTRVLWIDKESLLLKRMEIPIEGQRGALDPANEYMSYSVDIDFENVTLDAQMPDSAVALDVPEGGRLVRRFIPLPPTGPSEALGKPVKGYQFTNVSGEPVSASSLSGKIAVFDFWATDCPPCKEGIPILEKAYQQLKDESDVVFYGVSTDPKGLPNANVEKTLRAWGATFPLLRDFDKNAYYALNIQATPTLLVVGPDNRLQASHLGPLEDADDLVKKVRLLRDGGDLVELARQEHAEELKQHTVILDSATLKASLIDREHQFPKIAPRLLPEDLKVAELWHSKLANLYLPGDIATFSAPDGSLQEILVLDSGKAVVRYDAIGKELSRIELPKHEEKSGGFIRAVVDTNGDPSFLVSGAGWQQVFLFDHDWKLKLTFPDEPHSGVGDARFIDFKGNGVPSVIVGYWGGRGVQAGTLEGQSQWVNHYLDHVINLSGSTDKDSAKSTIWCASTRGTVLEIDAAGKSQREFTVPGHTMVQLLPRVSDEDVNYGLSLAGPSNYELVAFDNKGEVRWHYSLPAGDYELPIPPIQRLKLPGDEECLVVAAPNGSLIFVSLAGDVIDRFDYGKPIAGLAAFPSDEGTILLVSAGNRLTAWRIAADSAP